MNEVYKCEKFAVSCMCSRKSRGIGLRPITQIKIKHMQTTTTKAKTCSWPGLSGKTYSYSIYPIGTRFKEEGGNYIFCKKNAAGKWESQYIGQAKNLNERLGSHEKEACAKRRGATHIHAHLEANESTRLAEEKDLIHNFKPSCNTQHIH